MQPYSRRFVDEMEFRAGLTERYVLVRLGCFIHNAVQKIKSFEKRISNLEAALLKNPEEEARILQELNALREKKGFLMKNPGVLGMIRKKIFMFIRMLLRQGAKTNSIIRYLKVWTKEGSIVNAL